MEIRRHYKQLQQYILYENTPATDHFIRARIQSGMRKSKRDLVKTMTEYEIFNKYKARTAIS
jgi:hypothetical protein